MGFWTWVFIIIAIVFIGGIIAGNAQVRATNNRMKAMDSRLNELPDFAPTQQFIGYDGKTGLAVDEPRKKICLITNSAGNGWTICLSPTYATPCPRFMLP